jgi:hypothetical protein
MARDLGERTGRWVEESRRRENHQSFAPSPPSILACSLPLCGPPVVYAGESLSGEGKVYRARFQGGNGGELTEEREENEKGCAWGFLLRRIT